MICRFDKVYTQESRLYESDLGNIVADAFADIYEPDVVMIQSGSLRVKECGPVLTERDFNKFYPFDNQFLIVSLTGRELREGFDYLFSLKPDGSIMGGTFQFSRGFFLRVDATDCWEKGAKVVDLRIGGRPLRDDRVYRVGVTRNCADKFFRFFGFFLSPEQIRVVSLSTCADLATHFLLCQGELQAPERGRFQLDNFPGMRAESGTEKRE